MKVIDTKEEAYTGLDMGLESKFVTLPDGVEAHYKEAGPADAPAVILTHGFLGSLRDWRRQIMPLADLAQERGQPRRVIAVDWVGFGRSSKPELTYSLFYFADFLKKFIDALGLTQVDLIGHSMGGKHNLAFSVLYPSYVKKLVMVDTDGFLDDPWFTNYTNTPWFKPLANFSTELMGSERFIAASLKRVFFDPKFIPAPQEIQEVVQQLRDPIYKTSLRALNRDYPQLSLKLTGLRARLGEIKGPIQIFWGLQDRILHVDQGHQAQTELPGSQLYVFDRCGHFPQYEKADDFNRRTLKFLLDSE